MSSTFIPLTSSSILMIYVCTALSASIFGKKIFEDSLLTVEIEKYSIRPKLSAWLKHDLPAVGGELFCLLR
jgi:hypothetical protein